jgi:hypothetical protein
MRYSGYRRNWWDSLLLLVGFQAQRTNEPKSPDDRNNLYEPVPGDTRVDGDFSNLVIPSVSDWLAKIPLSSWARSLVPLH